MRGGMASVAMTAMASLAVGACGEAAPTDDMRNAVTVASPTNAVRLPTVATADATASSATASSATDAWLGRWVGVEGLVLTVGRSERPGTYALHLVLMDSANDYVGVTDGDTIRFTRDGKRETIRHATGEQTGLKWLADKRDCLVIRPGEGFCRD